jgi:predicted flavoprotein YhiN
MIWNERSRKKLKELKQEHAKKSGFKVTVWLPKPFVGKPVLASGIEAETKWADLSKTQLQNLSNQLTNGTFQVNGKKYF